MADLVDLLKTQSHTPEVHSTIVVDSIETSSSNENQGAIPQTTQNSTEILVVQLDEQSESDESLLWL